MPWGKITITYAPTDYTQNYKRKGVVTHTQLRAMIADAVADSVARLQAHPPAGGFGIGGPIVGRSNDGQNMDDDPGKDYRLI